MPLSCCPRNGLPWGSGASWSNVREGVTYFFNVRATARFYAVCMNDLDRLIARANALLTVDSATDDDHDKGRARVGSLRSDMNAARSRAAALAEPDHPDRERLVPPDWDALARAAEQAVGSAVKRMDAAAYLLETFTRAYGLPGFIAAGGCVAGLVGQYWDTLEPRPAAPPDGTAPAARSVAAYLLESLVAIARDQLPVIVRQIPLFETAAGVSYSLAVCERARRRPELEKRLADERQTSPEKRRSHVIANLQKDLESPSMRPWDSVAQELRSTQADVIEKICAQIAQAQAAWLLLESNLIARGAGGIVLIGAVRDVFATMLGLLKPLAPVVPMAPVAPTPAGGKDASQDGSAQALIQTAAKSDSVSSREQALDALVNIAQYFHQAEPQSPIGAAIDEIIRRARLSWVDLIEEMIPKKDERDGVLLRLGIRPPASTG